jgi:hypothetical protein
MFKKIYIFVTKKKEMNTTKRNKLNHNEVTEPNYLGKGNHSVSELENMLENYKELVHQLRIKKQALEEENSKNIKNEQ